MVNRDDNCILLFVKNPTIGQVKTRLAQGIGPRTAAELYRNFIFDILATLRTLNVSLRVFFDPPQALQSLRKLIGGQYCYVPQAGDDLGQRMKNAFIRAFNEGFSSVIVIGSDSPDMPVDFLEQAFVVLDNYDVVIGPVSDGGYCLIGFTAEGFCPAAFDKINWSTDRVFQQTFNILKQHRLSVYRLPMWHDVDTPADLELLLRQNENTAFSRSKTVSYILENKLGTPHNV